MQIKKIVIKNPKKREPQAKGTYIELQAENAEETELLRELFQGVKGTHYHPHSFGYNREMPKYSAKRTEATWDRILQENAKKQVLTFKRDKNEETHTAAT
jgi:hypothetical protein